MKRRNLKLGIGHASSVRHQCKVVLDVGGYSGQTEYKAKVELDPYDTAFLIRELRRELRALQAYVSEQVNGAEGPL